MVIARGEESPTLRRKPSRSNEPTNGEGKVNAVYKLNKCNESHMKNHEDVQKNYAELLKQGENVKVSDA